MRAVRASYGLTIFLGAFLLFQVEPMIARFILPWFGGTPDTWTTCLLFFQTVLFAGYLYARLLTKFAKPSRQAVVHSALLVVAAATLPIIPSMRWKEIAGDEPVLRILELLTVTVGLPYFALSATAPLLQSWLARTPGERPYRFYSLSNLGSLLALISYPLLIEPLLRLREQGWLWSAAFIAFVLLCSAMAMRFRANVSKINDDPVSDRSDDAPRPHKRDVFQWLLFAACGSMMLMAATNQLSQDVAVVPLLWVIPLALYLITFIVCFESERWYVRKFFTPVLLTMAVVAIYALQRGANLHFTWQVAIYCGTMFVVCMVCHGELARIKPHPKFLTAFYLWIAAGGALGGLFVAVIAPQIFKMLLEFELSLAITTAILLIAYYRDRFRLPGAERSRVSWPMVYLLALTIVAAIALVNESRSLIDRYGKGASPKGLIAGRQPSRVLERSRNFYGTLVVTSSKRDASVCRSMSHGRILHGEQFEQAPLNRIPLTYYGTNSGVGFALLEHPKRKAEKREDRALNIADVGMGVGTLASYGIPGDHLRFFEINPDVITLAKKYFTYIGDSEAKIEIVPGDGRISLEREASSTGVEKYDVLIVDAFSGDAVPTHLLTRECFDVYLKRLKDDGILAFHVSGRFLDLTPVVGTLACESGLRAFWADAPASATEGTRRAFWVLATKNELVLQKLASRIGFTEFRPTEKNVRRWTDDHIDLPSSFRR